MGGEKIRDSGEDAAAYSIGENAAMVGVFDGLGGSGARRYMQLKNKSGAYIASRAAAAAGLSWFHACPSGNWDETRLHDRIEEYLRICGRAGTAEGEVRPLIKGSMTRDLPTTVSMAVCAPLPLGVAADYYWAGDSRGYLLTGEGLMQLTRDDVGDEDLRASMNSDGVMNNLASLSHPWKLHKRSIRCQKPCIVITATDGCFGYVRTPMEFEYLLLDTLVRTRSVLEWQRELDTALRERAADDFTLRGLIFGFGSFEKMQRQLAPRLEFLYQRYIGPMEGAGQQDLENMWMDYSRGYYR